MQGVNPPVLAQDGFHRVAVFVDTAAGYIADNAPVNFGQKLGVGVQLLLFPAGEQPHMRAAFLYKEPPRASLAWASAMNCRA